MSYVMAFVIGATLNLLRFKLGLLAEQSKNASYKRRGLNFMVTTITVKWKMVAFNTLLSGLVALVAYYLWTVFA